MYNSKERSITLKHLVIDGKRMIGIQFLPNKVIQMAIKQLNGPKWSEKYSMVYLPNSKENLNDIFKKFKGVAWVDCSKFFTNRPVSQNNEPLSVDKFRRRVPIKNWKYVPEEFLKKLEIRRYSIATARSYISHFEKFINHYKDTDDLMQLGECEINDYLSYLYQNRHSDAYVKMSVNAIKFYFEIVKEMPNRFYSLRSASNKESLPKVISKEGIRRMINETTNIKHKCIIELFYSAGLRRQELIDLKIECIDSDRMQILVRQGKGKKDRVTLLSKTLLSDLRKYYQIYKPKVYLFEGRGGGKYSATSIRQIIDKAAKRAKIGKKVTPHILRHSFATHILENGTDTRYIQKLMGHASSKTTEIYTHVANNSLKNIKNPLDLD